MNVESVILAKAGRSFDAPVVHLCPVSRHCKNEGWSVPTPEQEIFDDHDFDCSGMLSLDEIAKVIETLMAPRLEQHAGLAEDLAEATVKMESTMLTD